MGLEMPAETPSPRGTKRDLDALEVETPAKAPGVALAPRQISIVLTGGPCSGKSSILALLRDRLSKRGFQVVTVPEYATHFFANSDGFQGEWVGTQKEEDLQNIFLRYQMMQEDMFRDFASLNTKTSVLLLDRATLDQKVFTSDEKIWQAALRRSSVNEQQLLERYDMVMHLGTCAKVGEYEWGPGSNNPGRYHSPDEAARVDKILEGVYKGHKQLRMVPHCKLFEDKVEMVMEYLQDALHVDGLAGKRQRIPVRLRTSSSDASPQVVVPPEVLHHAQAFVTTSTFLDEAMQSSIRRRVRMSVDLWLEGLKSTKPMDVESLPRGEQTFEERQAIPEEDYLARRVISEVQYHKIASLARQAGVDRCVLSFQDSAGAHYELFYFWRSSRELILDFTVGSSLPSWLEAEPQAEVKPHPARHEQECSVKRERKLARHTTAEAAHSQL